MLRPARRAPADRVELIQDQWPTTTDTTVASSCSVPSANARTSSKSAAVRADAFIPARAAIAAVSRSSPYRRRRGSSPR